MTTTTASYMPDWRQALAIGVAVGDTLAPVKIVELGDLECPACKSFHSTVRSVLRKHAADVSLIFVHFPLRQHRFALVAARAAECANDRGKFAQTVDVIYGKQDSLGLKSWGSYAQEAGIADSSQFAKCVAATTTLPRVEAGKAFGERIHLQGTPTLIINGWRLAFIPGEAELVRIVESLKKGDVPFDSLGKPSGR